MVGLGYWALWLYTQKTHIQGCSSIYGGKFTLPAVKSLAAETSSTVQWCESLNKRSKNDSWAGLSINYITISAISKL